MGNCLKKPSPTKWAGEEWGPAISPPAQESKISNSVNSVKVKITKKQLEEVIKKMKMEMSEEEGFTVQQVLEQLMKMSACYESDHITPAAFRPSLQTIPEFKSFHSSV